MVLYSYDKKYEFNIISGQPSLLISSGRLYFVWARGQFDSATFRSRRCCEYNTFVKEKMIGVIKRIGVKASLPLDGIFRMDAILLWSY